MENNISGFWEVPADVSHEGAFILDELAVLEVTGDDAEAFLHGQFTNHVKAIGDAFRLAAYCQPQGRILALMRVAKHEDKFYLVLPADLVAGFVKRLSMFILRSKVSIRIAEELSVTGLINPTINLPDVDKAHFENGLLIGRVRDCQNLPRALVIAPKERIKEQFSYSGLSGTWFESEILAGLPWVFEKTREAFIPQWINLDQIGGLVFDKGCYPGQEIISRVQHIGSTPRRMITLQSNEAVKVQAGMDVFADTEPAGSVVMTVNDADKTYALVEVTIKSMEAGEYQIQGKRFFKID